MWEVTKSFYFDAAHTLSGTTLGATAEEVHGHSFRAEVAIAHVRPVTRVTITRESCAEACTYRPQKNQPR
jgi:6-pyruvoyl-tetrahydropterin synthase